MPSRVALDLGGDDLLLKARQQPLRLVQGQTQISDIAEVIGSVNFHDVHASCLAIGADLHQSYDPAHAVPQVKDRPENARVAARPQNLRQSRRLASGPHADSHFTFTLSTPH